MKLNKLLVAFGIATLTFTSVATYAQDPAPYEGEPTTGQIQFTGSLVNSACGLTPDSSPVLVNFAEITLGSLKGTTPTKDFEGHINLQGCEPSVAKTATVTYSPTATSADNATLAAMTSGSASGAGIGLRDPQTAQPIAWNTKTTPVDLKKGDMGIKFLAFVQAVNASAAPTAGTFASSINFTVDYQ